MTDRRTFLSAASATLGTVAFSGTVEGNDSDTGQSSDIPSVNQETFVRKGYIKNIINKERRRIGKSKRRNPSNPQKNRGNYIRQSEMLLNGAENEENLKALIKAQKARVYASTVDVMDDVNAESEKRNPSRQIKSKQRGLQRAKDDLRKTSSLDNVSFVNQIEVERSLASSQDHLRKAQSLHDGPSNRPDEYTSAVVQGEITAAESSIQDAYEIDRANTIQETGNGFTANARYAAAEEFSQQHQSQRDYEEDDFAKLVKTEAIRYRERGTERNGMGLAAGATIDHIKSGALSYVIEKVDDIDNPWGDTSIVVADATEAKDEFIDAFERELDNGPDEVTRLILGHSESIGLEANRFLNNALDASRSPEEGSAAVSLAYAKFRVGKQIANECQNISVGVSPTQ